MKTYSIDHISDARNAGIAREHDLCHYFGIERTAHDSSDYRSNSDINIGDRHISVKASGFTLMSGNMCNGYDEFDDIWNLYKNTTHSNEFAYITEDYRVDQVPQGMQKHDGMVRESGGINHRFCFGRAGVKL